MRKSDKIFILPIILLGLNFCYRLINTASIIKTFPLDSVNDLVAYISTLHFFQEYGYLNVVPNWYNGFILFKAAAPGWYFFTYPIYRIFGDIMLSTYISIILLFILGGVGCILLGKQLKITKIKIIALFLFIFANPMAIGAFLKQGRVLELMALVILLYITSLALYFKDNKIDWKISLLSFLYGLLIITHQAESILTSIFLLGLILIKKRTERLYIILALIVGIILSSFWSFQFIFGARNLGILENEYGMWLLDFSIARFGLSNILLILLPIFLISIFFYLKREKKNLIFYSPLIILAILVLLRLVIFLPIIKQIYPDPYINFFLIFSTIFLVSLHFNRISKKTKTALFIVLIVISIFSVTYNITQTPTFKPHTEIQIDYINLAPKINGTYLIFSQEGDVYRRAYYSYTAIFHNKNTADGWSSWYKEADYNAELIKKGEFWENKDCSLLIERLDKFNVTEIISQKQECSIFVEKCGFILKENEGNVCLLEVAKI